ncbi:hypothetical protein VTO42DRAFT_8124 [Malbranchea cinnamomea]
MIALSVMKQLAFFLAGLRLAAGLPQHQHPTFSIPLPPTNTSLPTPTSAPTGSAPEGCKLLNTDPEWPPHEVWTSALPGVQLGNDTNDANRPDYILAVEDVAAVQAAVKFAAEHNIRLTVSSSGHDFLGRNDAPSGLGLDLSHLRGLKVLESFTPSESGAESPTDDGNVIQPVPGQQAAVTFGAGLTTQQINDALDASGLFTIGAAHGSVRTAGGFGQTAGHGPFSSKYGLAADQVLEYKVVTADGELVVANSVVNTDLFWALRGGGGGTFGIVVEATVKAHPTPKITTIAWWINATDSENPGDGVYEAAAYLHSQFPAINEKGVQGYYYVFPNAMRGLFSTADEQSGEEAAKAIWDPILENLASFEGMEPATTKFYEFASYKEYFDTLLTPHDCGDDGHDHHHKRSLAKRHSGDDATPMGIIPLDSRLLGKEHLESPDLAQALKDAMPQLPDGQLRGHLVGGGKVFDPDDDTSVLPAWRQAYVHLIGTGVGIPKVDSLRTLAPDTGAYVNEASAQNPNWKQDFWGSNYDRLSEIKTKYDPNGVFWVTPGVNADEFSVVDGRLCKIPTTDPTIAPANDNKNLATHYEGNLDNAPFPGQERNCTHEPEIPPDFNDEPDLDPSKPPITEGATLTKIRYGPYEVAAMDMISNRLDLNIELPCKDCFITALQADLEYEDGSRANINTGAWLHHMVLSKSGIGNSDPVCRLPLIERIYASGNERSVSRTNHVLPYGIKISRIDRVNMIYDLMNESDEDKTLYISVTYEWLPGNAEGYKPATMAWLDITGCGLSSYPAKEGQYEIRGPVWKSTVNGRLLSASGHVHNGGINTTIWKNGEPVCVSRQIYGRTPDFIAPPHDHGGGDGDGDHDHDHGNGEGKPSISDAEMCVDFGEVKVGDELLVSAYYDTDKYPLDPSHDGDGFEPIMGISRVYIGT